MHHPFPSKVLQGTKGGIVRLGLLAADAHFPGRNGSSLITFDRMIIPDLQ